MSATYEPARPVERAPLDKLRFLLGDISLDNPLVTPDETYTAVIVAHTVALVLNEDAATLELAQGMYARYAQEANKVSQDGVQSEEYGNRLTALAALIARITAKQAADAAAAQVHGSPFRGSVRMQAVW